MDSKPQMRCYKPFKNNVCGENYLFIKNQIHCIAMIKLRISVHKLAIEKGSYTNPQPQYLRESVKSA